MSRDAGRPLGASAAAPALVILLLLGLLLRLTIAYVLLPGSGFETDIATYSHWANRLYELGPGRFYEPGIFADYPPGYLYVLWIGTNIVAPFAGGDLSQVSSDLLKMPAILADVAIGYVLYRLVRGWLAHRPDAAGLGLLAAAVYLFNPITWYDSAVWGQTDAIGSLVILLGVGALVRGNSEGASLLAVLALLIKPQFGIVLAPLVGVVLLRRHLLAPGSNPRHRAWVPEGLRSWFEDEQGLVRLASSAVAGLILLLVMITPFGLSVPALIERIAGAAGGYAWLSVNAYNPWALVGSSGQQPIALGGPWSPDSVPLLGPLPGVVIGAALLTAGFLVGALRLAWREDRRSIIVVAVFLSLSFFLLPTRVHERYLFPVFALLPLVAVVDRRWLAVLIALSVAAFINFHGILTTPLYATPNLEGLPLGDWFRELGAIVASVALATAGFLYTLGRLHPRAAEEPDPYDASRVRRADRTPDLLPDGDGSQRSAAHAAGAGGVWARPADPHAAAPRSLFAPLREALGSLVAVVPLRRDRSPELASETGGRLDRLDLLLLVLLLLATLGLRTFRLEKPYGMHFDEVYHARTATEFLQHWRYGMPHSIYEYTHPHLAKYVMALGITAFGNNRVVAEEDLAVPVSDAAVERRWAPDEEPSARNGDRLYLATGADVRAFDLPTRAAAATILAPATHVAADDDRHTLFMADSGGAVWHLPTAELDALRADPAAGRDIAPRPLARLDGLAGDVRWVGVTGGRLVVLSAGGTVVSLDPTTGGETGRTTLAGAAEAVGVSAGDRLLVDPAQLTDIPAAAALLADAVDGDAARFEELLTSRTAGRVALAGYLDEDRVQTVRAALEEGGLGGVNVEDGSALAIATQAGVVIVDAETLDELAAFDTGEPVTGLALVERGTDRPTIYAAAGAGLETVRMEQDGPPQRNQRIEMPNTVRDAVWNPSTSLLHVPGVSQDGDGPTIYVLSPVSNSIFADARLSIEPVATVLDAQPRRPADERADLLAIDAAGLVQTVDTGGNAFAWRLPGVVAGALMAACLYLLARFLFRRRSVAVIGGLLVLADGMFFANARIAMNDTYVALFITAAMALFAPLWLGRWRARGAVAAGLLGVGLLLGLALASKWVAAYAIGGVGLLILLRSALGRVVALSAMIGLTAFLGYLAITPSADADGAQLNFLFLLLMLGLTVALAVLIALRPVRMTLDELRLLVAGPIVGGAAALLAGGALLLLDGPATGGAAAFGPLTTGRLLIAGAAGVGLGAAAYGAARLGRRLGWGPLCRPIPAAPGAEPAAPPPPRGWLRPGSGLLGLPWFGALAAITLIPLAVYIVSFVPWIELGNRWTADLPSGHTGQMFLDLQVAMYDYHNNLRATHAASSPWWAWPLDLKPVWFYKEEFAARTTAQIYDAGNLVLFWLAMPALGFAAYQAWRRRSLPLTMVVVCVACLWLPWARIDRVAFQYHIFTSLPFWVIGLAYFLAELWHGPSTRTWLLARLAGALAIIGPALLWLLRLPLCAVAGTQGVNPGTEVCAALSRHLVVTDMQALGLLAAAAALLLVGWLLWLGSDGGAAAGGRTRVLLPVVFVLALAGGGVAVLGAALPGRPLLEHDVRAEEPAFAALLLLAIPAYFVLRARDARRFVVGVLAAAGVWFVLWYPNIAALPVPSALSEVYQGLLPTWNYAFQFGANQDAPNRGGIELLNVGVLGLMAALLVAAAIYVARAWRVERAERRVLSALREAG